MSTQPTLFDYVPPAPNTPLFRALVGIAQELASQHAEWGVTVGEVVHLAEKRGYKVGGVPMTDPKKEQRQTSWLPRVMREAGLVTDPQGRTRPSPLPRHHKHRHSVWVKPDEERAA